MPKTLAEIRAKQEEANRLIENSASEYGERIANGDAEAIAKREQAVRKAMNLIREAEAEFVEYNAAKLDDQLRGANDNTDPAPNGDDRVERVLQNARQARAEIRELSQRDDYFEKAAQVLRHSLNPSIPLDDEAQALQRAVTIGTDTEGGAATNKVPYYPVAAQQYAGPMINEAIVNVVSPSDPGEITPVPYVDYTGESGSQKAEGAAHGDGTDLVFAEKLLDPVTWTSGFITLSWNVFNSANALQQFVETQLAKAALRGANAALTASTAMGFVDDAEVGKTSAQKAKIVLSDLGELYYSVDSEYRGSPKACMMAHDNCWGNISTRQVGAGDERFVLRPAEGAPPGSMPLLYLGNIPPIRTAINPHMPSSFTTASAKIVAYGDFGLYFTRVDTKMGNNMGIMLSVIEDTTTSPGVGVSAYIIGAGILADAKGVKVLRQSA